MMNVSDHLHVLVALLPKRESPVTCWGEDLIGPHSQCGCDGEEKVLPLLGIKPQSSSP